MAKKKTFDYLHNTIEPEVVYQGLDLDLNIVVSLPCGITCSQYHLFLSKLNKELDFVIRNFINSYFFEKDKPVSVGIRNNGFFNDDEDC